MATLVKMPDAPRIAILFAPGEETEPMTTDVAVEQFDFGEVTESELDGIAGKLKPGETTKVRCTGYGPAWTNEIRRID